MKAVDLLEATFHFGSHCRRSYFPLFSADFAIVFRQWRLHYSIKRFDDGYKCFLNGLNYSNLGKCRANCRTYVAGRDMRSNWIPSNPGTSRKEVPRSVGSPLFMKYNYYLRCFDLLG